MYYSRVGLIGMSVYKHPCDQVLMGRNRRSSSGPKTRASKGWGSNLARCLSVSKKVVIHGRYKYLLEF